MADTLAAPVVRLRPMDQLAERLIRDGAQASSTLARLIKNLETGNVIVYFDVGYDGSSGRGGSLRFMGASGQDRFLRVHVETGTATPGPVEWRELMVILAHELTHVGEVAQHAVSTAAELEALYRRIGFRTGKDRYETHAARAVGEKVLFELIDRQASHRARGAKRAAAHVAFIRGGSFE